MNSAKNLNRLIIILHAFIFSKYILNSTLFQYMIKRYEVLILMTLDFKYFKGDKNNIHDDK